MAGRKQKPTRAHRIADGVYQTKDGKARVTLLGPGQWQLVTHGGDPEAPNLYTTKALALDAYDRLRAAETEQPAEQSATDAEDTPAATEPVKVMEVSGTAAPVERDDEDTLARIDEASDADLGFDDDDEPAEQSEPDLDALWAEFWRCRWASGEKTSSLEGVTAWRNLEKVVGRPAIMAALDEREPNREKGTYVADEGSY